jgi:puromycin-sensitive aminopeptidase
MRVLLPDNVRPSKYAITLAPDFTTFKAQGSEEIQVSVKAPTSTIVVHSNDIVIHSAELVANGVTHKATKISLDEKEERATFQFEKELPVGEAVLKVKFEATLNDAMAGFYRSSYTVNGEKRWMATTQFEATDARRAFPCWDEPAVKAIFEITLVVPKDLVALSNMLPVDEKLEGDVKRIKFAPSPIMSTYLVAFVVGEFDYVEAYSKENVRVRVYTPVGKTDLGKFALDVGTKTLSYFTEYFGIAYPLPKMDMIAIADFAAGAMENWGLVTYREIALLIDEKNSSVSQKQRVAYVVAHELAHQWFGNLVTMEWWSQLWLNEGFATFVGQLATDHIFPEWDMWTLFVNDYQSTAFSLDSLKSSHPIEVDVKTSAEISEIFDAISYNKGSCVIRMLEAYLGEDNFRKGLNVYLKRHSYANAVTEDLWQALTEVSGVDVKKFMDAFTKEVNYPVVSVDYGSKDGTLEVSQKKFLSSGESTENDPTVWYISLKTSNGSKDVQLNFNEKKATLEIPFSKDDWIKTNYGQAGFYRVKYSPQLLAKLVPPLKSLTLPPVDRLGVQGDVFALVKAGVLPTSQGLDIALALRNEVDYTVWASLSANLGSLMSVFMHEAFADKLENFARHLYEPIVQKLGWDAQQGESASNTLLRGLVLSRLGSLGHEATVQEARKRFDAYLADHSSLAADLRGPVFEIVLVNGGQKEQDHMLKLYREAQSAEEKTRILGLIGQQREEHLTVKALEFTMTDEVRDQDLFNIYYRLPGVKHGPRVAWQFVKDNWEKYYNRLGKGGMILPRIIGRATDCFSSVEKAKEVEEFFKAHPYPQAERTVKQSIETIHMRAAWLERSRDDVANWLNANKF